MYDTYTLTHLLISSDILLAGVNLILTKTDCAYCTLCNTTYPYLLAY